ncbi:MAG: hypothetical protein ACI957_002000 [Verrucomicrobiales bacterium]|jgi:hypothetical protein
MSISVSVSYILLPCLFIGSLLSLGLGQDPPRQWYKGNTHTHSLWSDGNDFPDMITDWYVQAGYDFLALSDHNILSRGDKWMSNMAIQKRRQTLGKETLAKYVKHFGEEWVETRGEGDSLEVRLKTLEEVRARFEKPGEFLLMEAEEITDSFDRVIVNFDKPDNLEKVSVQVHINALNVVEMIPPQHGDSPRETMRNNLLAVKAQEERTGKPMLAHLNHPNFMWSLTAEDLAHVVEEDFFEVYNGHPTINHLGDEKRPGDERLWDIANTIRLTELQARPLFGLATDDSHQYHGGDVSPGRGWVMVHAAALESDALVLSMREGAFYASTGVLLADLDYSQDAKAIHFSIKAELGVRYETEIIGTRKATPEKVGETLAKIEGTDVHFPLTGDELYVRAAVTASASHPNPSFEGQRLQAWTQPLGWSGDR